MKMEGEGDRQASLCCIFSPCSQYRSVSALENNFSVSECAFDPELPGEMSGASNSK